ncbi:MULTISPECIES: histidine phosphatase family protein [unclassified Paludibacterium]|uniref:histidine phosphatase family protein n=1 Tax=unclassified Paludibacterium TaxID=2618429 RepID=UPI001C0548DE|nr:histidine phosphatase family protein [Paludibacterium sp. B53371]BEV71076.1 hypothetical protein THUN1379_05580 [Paludibacterium sp. THUN1379]
MRLSHLFSALMLCCLSTVTLAESQTETLVFIRHAEKQPDDLGQLTCQGLNRALALPTRLKSLFGKPDYLFAPDPAVLNHGFSYVRPLATLEPTAIQLAMPVNTHFGYDDIDGLLKELDQPRYAGSMVWIAWEHNMIEKLLHTVAKRYKADDLGISKWSGKDFDRIAVLTLTRDGKQVKVAYRQLQQELNGQSTRCPLPAAQGG